MKYYEYGERGNKSVVLIHGGGLSWWNYRSEAEMLKDEYNVILPVIDGHAESDRHFTTIEENAAEIISFIKENLIGHADLLGGLSLGAQIALEMITQCSDICSTAMIESAAVIPSKLTNALIGPSFSASYSLIKNRKFARLQFDSLHIRDDLFEDYYRDTCLIEKKDMIAFMKANTSYSLKEEINHARCDLYLYIGEKETGEIRKSARLIHETVSDSRLTVMPGMVHGDFSLNHPDQFVSEVRKLLAQTEQ